MENWTEQDKRFAPHIVELRKFNPEERLAVALDEHGNVVPADPDEKLSLSQATDRFQQITNGVPSAIYSIVAWKRPD